MKHLAMRLQNLGYRLLPPDGADITAYSSPHIFALHKFMLDDKVIDVIESNTHAAFSPIFFFDCTALMNFVSADSIFAAYPDLTTNHKALLNPFPIYKPSHPRVYFAHLQKYQERGFKYIHCEDSHASHFEC